MIGASNRMPRDSMKSGAAGRTGWLSVLPPRRPFRLVLGTVCCWAAVVGCSFSGGITGSTDPRASSVGQFARLVERYRVAHRGQMPGSEDDLRRFAAGLDAAELEILGIDSIDGCFVSGRDGQPLTVQLGPASGRGGDPSVICYETEGRDGTRLVGKLGGDVEAADEDRFAELVPAS
jgi:hypothetical protein